ncbi:MAG: VWA domain-containing protein [Chitinivibrionales bacterium]|nr:VWA domain-containing protein [Chitinivibrionales bacterium]MBD3395848.1 VWA domain-containing protein [Chitinivibrionales bacterium]
MRFRDPEFLLLLLLWVPMVWVYLRRERGSRPAVRFSDLSIIRRAAPGWTVRGRHALFALRLIGTGLLIIALARPQKGNTEEEVSTEGVDIMLVLDISTSMKALDFKPKNRLHVAKMRIAEFVQKRKHDRIGLVVFAGRSYTTCPLTLDYDVLLQLLNEVSFGDIEDGTAIGTAIATAANRLKDSRAKSRVMVLLTDGANNRGEIAPLAAADAAGELGMRIYTIGVGRQGEVPYPVDYIDRRTGKVVETKVQMIRSELDEQTLADIAAATDGRFFRAHNAEKLKEIYDRIDKLEKTEIKTTSYTSYSERFYPWLWAGFLLLLAELLLAHTFFRRIP